MVTLCILYAAIIIFAVIFFLFLRAGLGRIIVNLIIFGVCSIICTIFIGLLILLL